MINMLKVVMDKVGSMQEQIGNISRDVEALLKNQKEMPEIFLKMNRNEECP